MKINEKIRTLRTCKHLTQENMAEKLGISVNGYSKIENGKTKLTLDRIQEISQILDIGIIELINTNNDRIVIMANDNKADNSSTIFSSYHGAHSDDFDKLSIAFTHQQELLRQKDAEIKTLKEIIELLKMQLIQKQDKQPN